MSADQPVVWVLSIITPADEVVADVHATMEGATRRAERTNRQPVVWEPTSIPNRWTASYGPDHPERRYHLERMELQP